MQDEKHLPQRIVSSYPPLDLAGVKGSMVQMGAESLEPTLSFFTRDLGFRVEAIFPADNPRTAIISGHGINLQLTVGQANPLGLLTLLCDDPFEVAAGRREIAAPNGVVIRFTYADPPMKATENTQALVFSDGADATHWTIGRAGMLYRDLLPDRQGGAFIASHIRILDGGPVPDYVHWHKVRFQMIFCRKGWVRVLYEGQGGPIEMRAGDCVLQPPMIRHQVLECSAGAEVIEIGAPAEHITIADHKLSLPCTDLPRDHLFGGQRFVLHTAAAATWLPWRLAGYECQDTGIAVATAGLASVRVVRRRSGERTAPAAQAHSTEFCFYFVLAGEMDFVHAGGVRRMRPDESVVIPAEMAYSLRPLAEDLQLLEVTLPANVGLAGPARMDPSSSSHDS
jgi:mannose-6-phosphate isomerase-like protein (cupin superfamily)